MSRVCSVCDYDCDSSEYSTNQWLKGSDAKCSDCVRRAMEPRNCPFCDRWVDCSNSLQMHYPHCPVRKTCDVCDRVFKGDHALMQHKKSHVSRDVSCPVCGDKKFRNAANAIAHVESGYCTGCMGKDNARTQIHQFVSQRAPSLCVPMLQNGSQHNSWEVPDRPYECRFCRKTFKQLS
jgi:hypothetical protein